MINKTFITIIILAVVAVVGVMIFSSGDSKESNTTFDTVPDCILMDYEENEVTLSDFKGKEFVIISWASGVPVGVV